MIDFKLTEEQELLLESAEEFIKQGNYDEYFKECDREHKYPEKACNAFVEAGFHRIDHPTQFGGDGLDLVTTVLLKLKFYENGWPALCIPGGSLEIDNIMAYGTPEQQAKILSSWAPKIVVKMPATNAGIKAYEECAALGLNVAATVSFTVPQALAVGEAAARGKERAKQNGIKPGLTIAVLMCGRLDDYLRAVAHDSGAAVSERNITQAGIACLKKAYRIFNERGYDAVIMPAGLRGAYHLTEMAGGKLLYTINTRVQDMILAADPPQEERISNPVPQDVLNQLRKIPEFVRAYEPDGMKPSEFITYGVTQKLLSQFNETGWAPLETYLSNKKTNRWI